MINKSDPYFSFIVPVYNRANILSKTISSIIEQDYKNIEVIVVDDGSADKPEEVIKKFSDPRILFWRIENSERGAARNYGASRARGVYLNFFDSDDIMLPCLVGLKDFILEKNEPDVVFGRIGYVNSKSDKIKSDSFVLNSFTKSLLQNNFLACGSVFLKRKIAVTYPFHEDRRLSTAEDWELWLRVHAEFDFKAYPHNIFVQINHEGRSLKTIDEHKIEERDCYFSSLVLSNPNLEKRYGKGMLKGFVADRYSFIALSFVMNNQPSLAYHYLKKAIHMSPLVLRRKRFWAVLKKLITQ